MNLREGAESINGLIGALFPAYSGKGKVGWEKRPAARRSSHESCFYGRVPGQPDGSAAGAWLLLILAGVFAGIL
ncbi:MAG: hypothetical protein MUE63_00895 [Xanthomonadales bacterium]|nr:hypothetical protein [Xanthomonadales bacterium]